MNDPDRTALKEAVDRRDGQLMEDLHDLPGHMIRRLQQIAVAIFVAEITAAGHDLTPVQYAALATTAAHPGLDQATLAGYIAYDRSTIGGVVDRLVQKGLVIRQTSDRDRRARQLRATEPGLRLIEEIEPAVKRAQDLMLSGLDSHERPQFMALLKKATDATNDFSRAPLRGVGTGTGSSRKGTSNGHEG